MTGGSQIENQAVVPASANAVPQLPFQVFETRPGSITQHVIWDYELEKLVNISRPLTLGGATTLIGAFLGLLPSVIDTISTVVDGDPLGLGHLVLSLVAALCLAAGAVAGFFAYEGQKDAFGIRNTVRSRNIRAVNPPHQASA